LYYIPYGEVENQEKSSSRDNLPPGKNPEPATGLPSPDFRLSAPKTLPDLNKTPLQAILMVNGIVTRLGWNFWYYGGKSIAE
jgi:hypothetical protein